MLDISCEHHSCIILLQEPTRQTLFIYFATSSRGLDTPRCYSSPSPKASETVELSRSDTPDRRAIFTTRLLGAVCTACMAISEIQVGLCIS